jgi:hypothetical protein
MSPEQIQIIAFFAAFLASLLLLAGPILVMIIYGGWTKWILLAAIGLAALVTAASIGFLTPQ